MKSGNNRQKNTNIITVSDIPLKIFFVLSFFAAGLFFEWLSCIAAVYLLIYLGYCFFKTGKIRISKSPAFISSIVFTGFYGISSIWAIDKGMSILGFVKFLPIPLFMLAFYQTGKNKKDDYINLIPLIGAAMTVLSVILGFIPKLSSFFYVNERLGSFFQYPNSFAMVLLLGIGVLFYNEKWKRRDKICLPILLFGILLTGSRTVFILLVLFVIVTLFQKKKKHTALIVIGCCFIAEAAVLLYMFKRTDTSGFGHILNISLSSSTFLGRLLYYKDALPVILRHPFGLGYLGYHYLQGSFQTGVYSVQYIHNDFLQILLDIGWIPFGLFVYALIHGFKFGGEKVRILLLLLLLHCLLDFDLQFVAVAVLLYLLMETETQNEIISVKKYIISIPVAILGCLCLYFGTASWLNYTGQYSACLNIYPKFTDALISELSLPLDEDVERIADKILDINQTVSLAYSAKARAEYARGDFGKVISNKLQAIEYSKYNLNEYLDYFDMLETGIDLYTQYGDPQSSDYCKNELMKIPEMLQKVKEQSDILAWKINDKPQLDLPKEYQERIEHLKQSK